MGRTLRERSCNNIFQQNIDTVWTVIALHTTPGIPQYMDPVVAPLTNGVEMDVLGIAYSEFSDADHTNILTAGRRGPSLLQEIWLIEKLGGIDRG
jgi:hypothetical protein